MSFALGLDIGSTSLKAGQFHASGTLERLVSSPAPAIAGADPAQEFDPGELLEQCTVLLGTLADEAPAGTPIGIASQRSSFLAWDWKTGKPITPAISWKDRRAADWCRDHTQLSPRTWTVCGLPLSPHYLGPKLASMIAHDPALGEGLASGRLLAGTLDSWLLWNWCGVHEMDVTMAARTALCDPVRRTWDAELLQEFGIPVAGLPRIRGTQRETPAGFRSCPITATISDQASAALATAGPGRALVNFGTGTFVLQPGQSRPTPESGYLWSPMLGQADGSLLSAAEGTINAGGADADRLGPPAESTPEVPQDVFCFPDNAGWGSPFWNPDGRMVFSESPDPLSPMQRRALFLEGLAFRVLGILEDLGATEVVVTGGLSRDSVLLDCLASAWPHPVFRSDEPHASLLGAAALAGGWTPLQTGENRIPPDNLDPSLGQKWERWKGWARQLG
jgi:glycerol kinase